MSHNLRSPLRTIDGFSLILLEDYEDQLDACGKDYLYRMRGGAQRKARLIDDLLELSRLTRGELERENVNLSVIACHAVSQLRESQPDRKVSIEITPEMQAWG